MDRWAIRARERHAAVHALLAEGASIRAIGARLGLACSTVRRFARAACVEELLTRYGTGRRPSLLEEFKPYLHQRRIWEIPTGTERAAFPHHERVVRALAMSSDGQWIATSEIFDDVVRIWDAATGTERPVQLRLHGSVSALAISPDGQRIASADDEVIRIWEVATGTEHAAFPHHQIIVQELTFSSNGQWVASAGYDEVVRIWEVATGTESAVFPHDHHVVKGLTFSPNDQWIALVDVGGTIRVAEHASGRVRAVMRVDSPLYACVWTRDGQSMVVVGHAGFYLFDFNTEPGHTG
ncbi:hypothetical protein GCM10029964_090760 [Kibdelosporangium lantanae]